MADRKPTVDFPDFPIQVRTQAQMAEQDRSMKPTVRVSPPSKAHTIAATPVSYPWEKKGGR